MVVEVKPSQAASMAFAEFLRDERTDLAVKFRLGQNPAPALDAFARIEASAFAAGKRAGLDAIAAALAGATFLEVVDNGHWSLQIRFGSGEYGCQRMRDASDALRTAIEERANAD